MKTGDYSRLVALLAVGLLLPGVAARAQQTVSSGKIPITTSSDEARGLYLQGRDLAEKLRATDARYYYQQAIEKDRNFALAHLGLANTAPTNKEFFESVKRAVAVASSASEGERRLIMALDAGVKGDPSAQKEHLSALVDAFPNDERARNALGGFRFGRQEYGQAIAQYEKATGINPDFSPPYNNLGYAHRFLGDYGAAEQAFQPAFPSDRDLLADPRFLRDYRFGHWQLRDGRYLALFARRADRRLEALVEDFE